MKIWLAILLLLPLPALAQDKAFDLAVPPALRESGLAAYLLPRFSLKTGVSITMDDAAEVALGDTGTPVFRDADRLWHLSEPATPAALRFREWLLSDIGKRTVEGFEVDGVRPYSADVGTRAVKVAAPVEGDSVAGKTLSLKLCGRCHVVAPENRMKAIGSTPSFALMRTFKDWQDRFEGFYVLRPHPAFTQVDGVTPPFGANLPSPIVPITLDPDDIEAITAYVATIAPADLGAPIQSQ